MKKKNYKFSAIIEKEGKWFVALCPELDVASQAKTVEGALKNLKEAIELYLEEANPREYSHIHAPLITTVEVSAA